MFYRAAAVAIVLFWLVMTGLLVRLEYFPGTSDLLPVPVDHLFKLMFLHEQSSDLILFGGNERIGDLHLQPHRFPANRTAVDAPRNLLAWTGSMTLDFPGFENQHLTVRGALDLDDRDTVQRFELTASMHDPGQKASSLVVVCDGDPPRGRYHYQIRQGTAILADQAGPLETLLDQPALRNLGISPAAISGLARQQSAATELTARRGTLHAKGEDIETYDVTVRQGDTMEATVQLSQLGQVLSVKTFAGYSLLDESFAP